jgi:hypothetical protein
MAQALTNSWRSPRCIILWLVVLALLSSSFTCSQEYANNDYGDYDYGDAPASSAAGAAGGDYQDYADPYAQPDNLYADYAATKMEGAGGGGAAG